MVFIFIFFTFYKSQFMLAYMWLQDKAGQAILWNM